MQSRWQWQRSTKFFARIRLNLSLNSGVKQILFATNALFPVIGSRWIPVKLAPVCISTHLLMTALATNVLRLYSRRTAANTLDFIDCVIEEMPFPIQRLQTDRGIEFFAVKVQEKLKKYSIKFRPNKPASPHLNGKVERSQKTDKAEFYATVDLSTDDLKELLAEW